MLVFFSSGVCFAQKEIKIRNLWIRPQVHVKFNEYTLSFSIRDINRALELLNEMDVYDYGTHIDLDTTGNYQIELLDDNHTQYKDALQPLIQNGVGVFLLTKGLTVVKNSTQKRAHPLKTILMDYEDIAEGSDVVFMHFYDPATHKLLFSGKMKVDLYNKDMGIDYY